jgi:hypothetical protein
MKAPYIGVTGFMSREEVERVLEVFPEDSKRKLMVGILASDKTLRGIPNKQPGRYPKPEDIAGIFPKHPSVLNLVHLHVQEQELVGLFDWLLEVTELGGKNLHGFQLNVKWPDTRVLKKYKDLHSSSVFVLQCGSGALESAGNDPKMLARFVRDYVGLCDYVLLDPSGGQGKAFVPEITLAFLDYLYDVLDGVMNIGVAGGLGAPGETTRLLQTIFDTFPDVSVDAEGKLREMPSDVLNVERARSFICEVAQLCSLV